MPRLSSTYLSELKRRARESHVYRNYQLFGLEIAGTLHDERHKSLYIKLAKEYGGERLLRLAKEVAERRDVKNPGAYFMSVLSADRPAAQKTAKKKPKSTRINAK